MNSRHRYWRIALRCLALPLLLGLPLVGVQAQSLTKPTTPTSSTCHCYHLSRVVTTDWGTYNMKDFHLVAPKGMKLVVRTDDLGCWRAERVFFTRARLVDDATGQVEDSDVAHGEVTTPSSLSGTQQTSPIQGSPVPGHPNEVRVDGVSWADATGESNPPPNPTDQEAQGGGGLNLPNPPAGKHYDFVHVFLGWRFCYPGLAADAGTPYQRLSWYVTKSGGRTTPKTPTSSPVLTGETADPDGTVKSGKRNDPPTTPPTPNPDPPDPPDTSGFTPPSTPADPTGAPSGGLLAVSIVPDNGNPDPLPSGVAASFDLSGYEGLSYEVVVSTALDGSNELGVDPLATPPQSWGVTLTGASGTFGSSGDATMTVEHGGGAPPGSKLYLVHVAHDPSPSGGGWDMFSRVVTVNLP